MLLLLDRPSKNVKAENFSLFVIVHQSGERGKKVPIYRVAHFERRIFRALQLVFKKKTVSFFSGYHSGDKDFKLCRYSIRKKQQDFTSTYFSYIINAALVDKCKASIYR